MLHCAASSVTGFCNMLRQRSHIVRLAMNIPISGTNSLITFPASAPFTLYGMKRNNKKKQRNICYFQRHFQLEQKVSSRQRKIPNPPVIRYLFNKRNMKMIKGLWTDRYFCSPEVQNKWLFVGSLHIHILVILSMLINSILNQFFCEQYKYLKE